MLLRLLQNQQPGLEARMSLADTATVLKPVVFLYLQHGLLLGGRAGSLRARWFPSTPVFQPVRSPFLRLEAQAGLLKTPVEGEKP